MRCVCVGQVMQPALVVIANCVMVPASLAHLLPPPDRAPVRKKACKAEKAALFATPQPQPEEASVAEQDLQTASSCEVSCSLPKLLSGRRGARQLLSSIPGPRDSSACFCLDMCLDWEFLHI